MSTNYYGSLIGEDGAGIYYVYGGSIYTRYYTTSGNLGKYQYSYRNFRFSKGDTFINDSTGHKYTCTETNTVPSSFSSPKLYTRSWKYSSTSILTKPSAWPSSITTKMDGTKVTVSWAVPSAATDKKSCSRATNTTLYLYVNKIVNDKSGRPVLSRVKLTQPANVAIGTKSHSFNLDASKYFPNKSEKLSGFGVAVCFYNSYGDGPEETQWVTIGMPKEPTMTAITQNANTGILSTTIEYKVASKSEHFYDMRYIIQTTKYTASNQTTKEIRTVSNSTQTKKVTLSQDVPERQSLYPGDYITVKFLAWSRGMAGESKNTTKSISLGVPKTPTLKLPSVMSRSGVRAIFTVGISSDTPKATGCRLQALVSSTYAEATDIPGDTENPRWENVGQQDDGGCTALSVAMQDILPEPGRYTWVRVKCWNAVEALHYAYSEPKRLKSLEIAAPPEPSAGDDTIVITQVEEGDDGVSAKVSLVWDPNGTDDSNWTEVSWSERKNAWKSSDPPQSFTFADQSWNEGQKTYDRVTYRKSTHIYIYLEPDVKYIIKARRVMRPEEGEATFGPYSGEKTIRLSGIAQVPDTLQLTAPETAIRGEAIPLYWTYGVPVEQSSWKILRMGGQAPASNDIVLATGSDQRMFLNLPYYRGSGSSTIMASSSSQYVTIYAVGTVFGTMLTSNAMTVKMLDKPYVEVACNETLLTRPAMATVFTDSPNGTVSIAIRPRSATYSAPDGNVEQDGWVWSETLRPDWQLTGSYASQTEVQQKKQVLDARRSEYDAVMTTYRTREATYLSAMSTIADLEESIARDEISESDLTDRLADYQDRIDGMDEDDELYDFINEELESTQEELSEITAALASKRSRLTTEESTAEQARQQMESMESEIETKSAALNAAIEEYATVAAQAVMPAEPGDVTHKAMITVPEDVQFADLGEYEFVAYVTDNGIKSEAAVASFSTAWSHKAQEPSIDIGIMDVNEADEDGVLVQGTEIELPGPVGAFESDVYDLYRKTRDGVSLALAGIPLGSKVSDKYAAFGASQYVVASRTEDGSLDWKDYWYHLRSYDRIFEPFVRLDWDGRYLVMDRGTQQSESFEKDFETHKHLDGSISGHWRNGVGRTMNVSAQLVRGYEDEQEEALRNVARYEGPCLVRTSDGIRLEGNVNVDTISYSSATGRVDVSLTVTETNESQTFVPTIEET